ncbi:MAG: hypothetical protein U0K28_02125 [Prevotellamassilia sp.]|nr:hypothetical protein [Prevotellamassilia sp.]
MSLKREIWRERWHWLRKQDAELLSSQKSPLALQRFTLNAQNHKRDSARHAPASESRLWFSFF